MESGVGDSDLFDDNCFEDDHQSDSNPSGDQFSSLSFEEVIKLKEQLGTKLYKEARFGRLDGKGEQTSITGIRFSKVRPTEMSCTRPVPFLGAKLRRPTEQTQCRDPRFEEASGSYKTENFKENFKFVTKIRAKEVAKLKKKLTQVTDEEERGHLRKEVQRLANKNVEDHRWRAKHLKKKEEHKKMQKAYAEGKQPIYVTKQERHAKDLVEQYERLKNAGKLNRYLEKRRKKNAAKDRKKIGMA